jgi:peptidoglycan recognition protein
MTERRILDRETWGAKAPRSKALRMSEPATRTYIHHTVGPAGDGRRSTEADIMRDIQRFHQQSRGWSDIAYSFVIFPSGRIYEGRGWGIVGAHTEGQNSTSHAICFAGNFETDRPTLAALEAAAELYRIGVVLGHIRKGSKILGHRDAPGAATACPGTNLYSKLDRIRRLVKEGSK